MDKEEKGIIIESMEPERSKSLFSGGMAQIMVFLNGLILTIVAYATLSVFIQEIVNDNLLKITQDKIKYVSKNIHDIEQTIHTVETIVALSNTIKKDNLTQSNLQESIERLTLNTDPYDQIFWIKKSDQNSVFQLLKDKNKRHLPAGPFTSSQALLKYLESLDLTSTSKDLDRDGFFRIITDFPGSEFLLHGSEPKISSKPFLIVKPIWEGNVITSYIIGLVEFFNVFSDTWLDTQQSLSSIKIKDMTGTHDLYSLEYPTSSIDKTFPNNFSFQFGGSELNLSVVLKVSQRESFLEKIPLLMLLFGVTLTLIGTLYVRNNQKQSLKLATMNKELGKKNIDLNNEINEREKLNQVIRKAERENRAIIDSVSDIIFEVSTTGEILFLNQTWQKVTGFEIEQSVGRNIFDMLYLQDQDEQKRNFEMLVKGQKQAYRAFTRLRSSEGTFRAVELAVSMVRQDDTGNMRVVGTVTDVEERRRAERALSEAEKKYRTIVENAAGGIYQVTQEGQFLSANRSMARILGYDSPEQILREIKNSNTQLYVDERKRVSFLKELDVLDINKNCESQIYKQDGKVIWVSENVRPVHDEEGNLLYFEGSMEDVTKRKEAEIGLREAKLQSDLASRAKSEFLANMSHELRTPLNAIIGFSEIIKNEVFGPVGKKEYWDYANDIYDSGKKLLNVINEILDVSRIEAGDRKLNEGAVDVEEVIKDCLQLMRAKIDGNNMVIKNHVKGSGFMLVGEEHAIKQMLMNLMSNAIKFTPTGGTMTISAEMDAQEQLSISVTDTGIGLEDHEIDKALSPFGQIDAEMNKASAGMGLGLTLVNSLIKLHEGSLELFSQKGIGTTATLIFPSKRSSRKESQSSANDLSPINIDG